MRKSWYLEETGKEFLKQKVLPHFVNYYRQIPEIGKFKGIGGIGFPWWLSVKDSACNAGDMEFRLSDQEVPLERNGNSLQYACLGNPMDRGTTGNTVHGVAKSWSPVGD